MYEFSLGFIFFYVIETNVSLAELYCLIFKQSRNWCHTAYEGEIHS